jgi:signal transduction histidine kinase
MATAVFISARTSKNHWLRYIVALLAVVVALLIRGALNPLLGDSVPYVILFPAVVFSAWYCGLGPSLFSVVLCLVGSKYWFIPPVHSFNLPTRADSIGMLAFLFGSAFIVTIGEARRHENEKLRQSQGELEARVKERTAELDCANESLRELTARLLQLRDEERRRFARELHDSVGQVLAALSINLSTARTDIERLAKTVKTLSQSETLVQEMSKEVRTISHLLHPPLLDEAGLSSALRWYVDGFAERSNIKVDLEFPDDFGRVSRELETAIFRLVQECLTNIHRHSGSPIAKIRIVRSDGAVLVEVSDHGKGIAAEKLIKMDAAGLPGVGIRGMRERIRQLGGRLEINSEGQGTMIRARLPVANTSSIAAA